MHQPPTRKESTVLSFADLTMKERSTILTAVELKKKLYNIPAASRPADLKIDDQRLFQGENEIGHLGEIRRPECKGSDWTADELALVIFLVSYQDEINEVYAANEVAKADEIRKCHAILATAHD